MIGQSLQKLGSHSGFGMRAMISLPPASFSSLCPPWKAVFVFKLKVTSTPYWLLCLHEIGKAYSYVSMWSAEHTLNF